MNQDDPSVLLTTRRLPKTEVSDPSGARAQLVVVRGPDAGQRFALASKTVVGRDSGADVLIDDDGVSRTHLEIVRESDGGFRIRDLESRNGTFVNGVEVSDEILRYGDRIALGAGTTLMFAPHDAFEEQRLRAERLQALGELAAGIAHDFNNHLAAILGNISYLRSPRDMTEDELSSCHADIEVATRKSAELVAQLLAFAQPRLDGGTCQLTALAQEVTSLLRRTLSTNIELVVDVPDDVYVAGDEGQLHQVLTNLCINGADSMPEGGRVEIRATAQKLARDSGSDELPPGDYVRLEVSDQGTGMDESTRRRALEPFFTTKPRGKGTGLGLATVARIIDLHGGLLELESEPGQGTTVRMWLPRAKLQGPDRLVNRRTTLVDLGEKRVLLVDDEEIVLRSTARLLERSGAEVQTASDGESALALFRQRQRPITLVVLDLDMPGMDGAETLIQIRAIDPGQPVLIVTGHVDPQRINKVLALPRVSLLRKPYDYRTLADAVDRAVES